MIEVKCLEHNGHPNAAVPSNVLNDFKIRRYVNDLTILASLSFTHLINVAEVVHGLVIPIPQLDSLQVSRHSIIRVSRILVRLSDVVMYFSVERAHL